MSNSPKTIRDQKMTISDLSEHGHNAQNHLLVRLFYFISFSHMHFHHRLKYITNELSECNTINSKMSQP